MASPTSRLTPMTVESLTPEQRAVYDSINSPPRVSMGFAGPYAAYIKAPAIGALTEKLGAIIRFNTACSEHFKKIASCIVGQYHQAKFEFAAQTPFARDAGLSESVIESLRKGETPEFDSTDEKIIYEFCHQFVHTHRASDENYTRARDLLGETQLVELIATIAYYTTVCITLNAFEVPLAEGMEDPFPD
jgi:4-carboxymuconolactone decarboxylase